MAEQDPEARRRALRALATGGTQAKNAQDEFERQIRADRQRAAQAAMADAVRIDAPQAGAELQPRIDAPFDRYAAAAGSANQSRLATLRQMEAANRTYMSQVNAARPVVEGLARAKAAERAAKASKEKELSDSELRTRLMGAAGAMREDLAGRKAALQTGSNATAGTVRMTDMLNADPANAPQETLARRLGTGAGLDPARVHGLVPDAEPPKVTPPPKPPNKPYTVQEAAAQVGINDPRPLVTRASPVVKGYKRDGEAVTGEERPFDDAVSTAEQAKKEKWTAAELNESLADFYKAKYGHDFPQLRRLILASYGHLLGGA